MPEHDDDKVSKLEGLTREMAHKTLVFAHKTLETQDFYQSALSKSGNGLDRVDYQLKDPLGALTHYVSRVAAGAYPDPDIATYIARCFSSYLNQKPKERVTLDVAFGLKGSQNSHPVIAYRRLIVGNEWRNQIWFYQCLGLTKKKAAEQVHENLKNAAKKQQIPSVISMLKILRMESKKT